MQQRRVGIHSIVGLGVEVLRLAVPALLHPATGGAQAPADGYLSGPGGEWLPWESSSMELQRAPARGGMRNARFKQAGGS